MRRFSEFRNYFLQTWNYLFCEYFSPISAIIKSHPLPVVRVASSGASRRPYRSGSVEMESPGPCCQDGGPMRHVQFRGILRGTVDELETDSSCH